MADIGITSQVPEKVPDPAGYTEILSVSCSVQDKVKLLDLYNKLKPDRNIWGRGQFT